MISVHAGQCGNQLGYCVLDSLFDHLVQPSEHCDELEQEMLMNHFFRRNDDSRGARQRGNWIARSVCIDTEPKVIHDCVSRADEMKKWFFHDRNTHYEYGGAGNNWARGYQLFTGDFRDASMNSIRLELEVADVSPTLMITHSIGGGTGSGLGTRMSEAIYDEFPDVSKINLAVMPYHFGEVAVQHYNSVLCLAKVAEVSDAIILCENEYAHEMCVKMRSINRPTLYDVNRAITTEVVPALIPKVAVPVGNPPPLNTIQGRSKSRRRYLLLCEDILHLCIHPNYKFLTVKNTPQTSDASKNFTYDSWSTILSSLQRMNDCGSHLDRSFAALSSFSNSSTKRADERVGNTLINCSASPLADSTIIQNMASSIIMRGPDACVGAEKVPAMSCSDSALYFSDHVVNGYQRSACLLSNGQSILPSLQRPLKKGANMFRSGAYVHQYESCGLEMEEFVRAFRTLGGVINDYVTLSNKKF